MTSLLKEFAAYGDTQQDLKSADGSDAGRGDVTSKPVDVRFSLMRNMINKDGNGVQGSDVNDYLERAHDLNDEVETVGFAIEDDDGGIIKVYVNANEAGAFEEEMSKVLGLDDDIESAINQLAQKYDIVDVVWPEDPETGEGGGSVMGNDEDADLTIDSEPDAFSIEDPVLDDPEGSDGVEANALPADDDSDDEGSTPAERKDSLLKSTANAADGKPPADDETPPDEDDTSPSTDANAGDETPPEGEEGADKGDETDTGDEEAVADDEELEPVLDDKGHQKLDDQGNPVMRKKRKKPEADDTTAPEAEVTEEGLRDDILRHVANITALGNKGKFYIETLVTGGHQGRKRHPVTQGGKIFYFTDHERAIEEAAKLNKLKNRAGFAKASYKYEVKMVESKEPHSLDKIRAGLKPIMSAAAAVDSQDAYDKFLKGFGSHAEVVDTHINPDSIDSSADRLHYHQKDPDVAEFLKKHVIKEQSTMTLGSKFLSRITEAADTDGVADGINIPLDSSHRTIVASLKRPLEKKIVGLFAMAGVLGRALKSADGSVESIQSAADMLRKNSGARSAFNVFFTALASAKGYGVKTESLQHLEEAGKLKRGSTFQKKFETVLTKLGLPGELVATDGPSTIAPLLYKTAKMIDGDGALKASMTKLAQRLGISMSDVTAPAEEDDEDLDDKKKLKPGMKAMAAMEEGLTEADDGNVNVGNDPFMQAIVALALALGIPESNLEYQRAKLVQSVRKKKQMLSNRGMIEQRMEALLGMVKKATRQAPNQQEPAQAAQGSKGTVQAQGAEANESLGYFAARAILKEAELLEAFGDLEALTKSDLEVHNVAEPSFGPAMAASYEGGGTHEETMLIVGVDPEAEGSKTLVVSIDGPWDGNLHRKTFSDDKDGYKRALDYANILRSANLKTGGRPRGWKDEPKAVEVTAVEA